MKKFLAMALAASMMLSLAACGGGASSSATGSKAASGSGASNAAGGNHSKATVLQVGFENSSSEPFSKGVEKWKALLASEGDGSIAIQTYPDSQLGNKSDLIDSMTIGEGVCTLADGAFYADYGVPDFGIVFGPYLFDNWDQCWALTKSDWYAQQCAKLEKKGLHIIASNWVYGARQTLTTKKVETVKDLAGLKIRVPTNEIQTQGFNVLGATAVGMSLGDVYTALQQKTIDGAENPLPTLYGRKLQEVAKYLILDNHVLNFTTLVCSADWYNALTPDQQKLLTKTCEEAGKYNNQLQTSADQEYLKKMKAEGVQVITPSEEVMKGFKDKAQAFYKMGSKFGWSDGLYDTVKAAMKAS